MRRQWVIAGVVAGVVAGLDAAGLRAQGGAAAGAEGPHQWLLAWVGEWSVDASVQMDPDLPPMTAKGTEKVSAVGSNWIIARTESDWMGMPYASALTLGYDDEKKKFVGTWIDSFATYMWVYEGTLDAAGKVLTLETEGPGPNGEHCKFRETTEMKSPDHRHFTSSMQGADGAWTQIVTMDYRRVK